MLWSHRELATSTRRTEGLDADEGRSPSPTQKADFCLEHIAAFAGVETFDLIHQFKDDLNAGKIDPTLAPQVLDLLQGPNAGRVKKEPAVFRVDERRDETVFAADEHDVPRHACEMRGAVDWIKDVGGWGEPLQRVDVNFGFNLHDFYSLRIDDEERGGGSRQVRRVAE
jgi:hypothetical protein